MIDSFIFRENSAERELPPKESEVRIRSQVFFFFNILSIFNSKCYKSLTLLYFQVNGRWKSELSEISTYYNIMTTLIWMTIIKVTPRCKYYSNFMIFTSKWGGQLTFSSIPWCWYKYLHEDNFFFPILKYLHCALAVCQWRKLLLEKIEVYFFLLWLLPMNKDIKIVSFWWNQFYIWMNALI